MADSIAEKVKSLVALATDKATSEAEARTAAMQAVNLIASGELAVVPKTELEAATKAVQGAELALRKARTETTKNMLMGGVLGAILAKKVF